MIGICRAGLVSALAFFLDVGLRAGPRRYGGLEPPGIAWIWNFWPRGGSDGSGR